MIILDRVLRNWRENYNVTMMIRSLLIPFLFISVALINCNSNKKQQINSEHQLRRTWMLVEFQDFDKAFLVQNKAYLDLTESQQQTAHSNVGCNTLNFYIDILQHNRIKFSGLKKTKKYCNETINLENRFLQELRNVQHYHVQGHFLKLSGKNGNVIKFVAEDWD